MKTVTSMLSSMFVNQYFIIIIVEPSDIWTKLRQLKSIEESYSSIFLLAELCLCAPYLIAQLERFLKHIKYVKLNIHSSLTHLNLSSLLKIKMLSGEISVNYFNNQLSIHCVEFWYNPKDKHIHQKKAKVENSFHKSSKKYDNSTFLRVIQKQTTDLAIKCHTCSNRMP